MDKTPHGLPWTPQDRQEEIHDELPTPQEEEVLAELRPVLPALKRAGGSN